jgi:hypothetical protein
MAPKRKALQSVLNRRVRVRQESTEELNSALHSPSLNHGDHQSEEQKSSELENKDQEVCTTIFFPARFTDNK